jgi:hypothetical protein
VGLMMVMTMVMIVMVNGDDDCNGLDDAGDDCGGGDSNVGIHTQIGTSIPNIAGCSMAANANNVTEATTSRSLYKVV